MAASQAALDLARRTLGRVQVRVAFGGVVTRVWRGPGALVDGTAATPIAQIAAALGAELAADATERDLARIETGDVARVELTSAVPPLAGAVRAISSALDTGTGLGVVRISLTDPPASLIMGAQARVTITTGHRDGVVVAPIEALRGAIADGAEVVVCSPSGASIRAVKVGYRDDQRFEVLSGLAADEKIAIDHVLGLENGTALVQAP